LILIAADRDHKPLVCPSCGADAIERTPPRSDAEAEQQAGGRVTLHCGACGRTAVYINRGPSPAPTPDTSRLHR